MVGTQYPLKKGFGVLIRFPNPFDFGTPVSGGALVSSCKRGHAKKRRVDIELCREI